ncbi:MAG: hypothetical protein MZV64_10420 [Ignavibacteriales bacterium]|nr:hypothetical protein [Ignavibacteriales bacterium]
MPTHQRARQSPDSPPDPRRARPLGSHQGRRPADSGYASGLPDLRARRSGKARLSSPRRLHPGRRDQCRTRPAAPSNGNGNWPASIAGALQGFPGLGAFPDGMAEGRLDRAPYLASPAVPWSTRAPKKTGSNSPVAGSA